MSEAKPRRVRARVTRTVTELAIVTLDRHGHIEEFIETLDEIELVDIELRAQRQPAERMSASEFCWINRRGFRNAEDH